MRNGTRMTITVDFVNHTKHRIAREVIVAIVRETLRRVMSKAAAKKTIAVSIALVAPSVIRGVNRQYRGRDRVTDVISFGSGMSRHLLLRKKSASIDIGDLLLCYDYIKKSATIDGVSARVEFAYVLSHCILHLLGYRHSKEMFAIQDAVSQKFSTLRRTKA